MKKKDIITFLVHNHEKTVIPLNKTRLLEFVGIDDTDFHKLYLYQNLLRHLHHLIK